MDKLPKIVSFVILSYKNKVLVCYENRADYQNLWEFPGGKVEFNENIFQSAIREVEEELDICLNSIHSLGFYETKSVTYKKIKIYPFFVELNSKQVNSIKPKIQQQIKFVKKSKLLSVAFLEGSYGGIFRYLLPDKYMITKEPEDDFSKVVQSWEQKIESGIRLIQLRVKKCSKNGILELAKELKKIMDSKNGFILINSEIEIANKLNLGLHLPSELLMNINKRIMPRGRIVSASCHNDEQIQKAQKFADIGLVSPFNKIRYPNQSLITEAKFKKYSKQGLVTYALSGMKQEDICYIRQIGGQGIAAIRAFE